MINGILSLGSSHISVGINSFFKIGGDSSPPLMTCLKMEATEEYMLDMVGRKVYRYTLALAPAKC